VYKKIDHLAIAVRNLEETLEAYKSLGFSSLGIASFPEIGIRQAFLAVGDSYIQLVESLDPQGPIAKFVEQKGEGLYLVAVTTDDLRSTLDEIKRNGGKVIGDDPDNLKKGGLVMIHPRSAKGVLIQLVDKENRVRDQAIQNAQK